MTWWELCRAAWTRWDEWRGTGDDPGEWLRAIRRQPDHQLGPRETPRRPGQRYVGRHRLVPDEPVRRPS